MNLVNFLVRKLSSEQDVVFKLLLNDDKDEYGNKYSEVYAFEYKGFLDNVRQNLLTLLNLKNVISIEMLKTIICINWFCNLQESAISDLDSYAINLINEYYLSEVESSKLEITDIENEFIENLLKEKALNVMNILIELIEDNDTENSIILKKLQEIDTNKHFEVIENFKKTYVRCLNILYKLFKKHPTDYRLELEHNKLCEYYNINRLEFVFS